MGPDGRPDDPVVGRRQRHRRLHAVRRNRRAPVARRERAQRSHRRGVQRRARVRRHRRHELRRGAVHLRHGGGHDPRLEPRRPAAPALDAGPAGRRPFGRRRDLQGPGRRPGGTAPVRDRLPQRPGGRVRQLVHPSEPPRSVHRPEDPRPLRAVRHPGHRRDDLRHLREAGRRRRGRRGRPRAGVRRRVRHRRHAARPGGHARPAGRPVGGRMGAGGLRPVRRRPPRRELRQRSDQRVRGASEREVGAPRPSPRGEGPPAHHRRAVGPRVRQREPLRPDRHAVLHGRSARRVGRAVRLDRAPRSRSRRSHPPQTTGPGPPRHQEARVPASEAASCGEPGRASPCSAAHSPGRCRSSIVCCATSRSLVRRPRSTASDR